ncbi:MAG: AEC family transporter [Desulfobacterales bacterium]|nr:MAG: AEC family transporter [Desulfobacterales bacterium]
MNIVSTIIPIFSVIILGWLARWKGFIQQEFLEPANRLVYYLAIPALIFRAISKASLKSQFDVTVLGITLFSVAAVFAIAWGMGFLLRLRLGQLGTFIQTTFHGNLGYIGLAIAFYLLGNEGFVRASIIAGFLIILQNFLSVISLQFNSDDISVKRNKLYIVLKILGNPVILSALGGILFSLSSLKMPLVIDRSLQILGGLALPMALLIIGASLSFELMQLRILRVISSSLLKLILLPGIGFSLYRIFGMAIQDYLPALILLASPTATITYVMAREMGGDVDFAVAAISTSTLISSVTFTLWINIASM